jgi:hypothetical protein
MDIHGWEGIGIRSVATTGGTKVTIAVLRIKAPCGSSRIMMGSDISQVTGRGKGVNGWSTIIARTAAATATIIVERQLRYGRLRPAMR